ncbi:hypothetical protein [Branchiibius cervicis]|uniref:DUF2116 family Zn-ribbon domain-containing protein n=1 Tax=Branchiibius cervicis TaxID=908252 RepID=A0ABW2AMX7_9MICO
MTNTLTCRVCGSPFTARRVDVAKTCSQRCRSAAHRQRIAEDRRELLKLRALLAA